MTPTDKPCAVRAQVALIFAAWTAYGLGYVALLEMVQPSGAAALPGLVRVLVAKWYWAALTQGIFLATERLLPARVGAGRSVAAHAALALTAAAGGALVNWSMRTALDLGDPDYLYLLIFHLPYDLAAYLLLVLIALALHSHRHSLAQGRDLLRLERQLAEARLRFLQRQLQPHFLFNALNAIAELTREAPASASRMLGALRRLLGVALGRDAHAVVTLREELAALEPFLEIQQTRFSDSLTVQCQVEEAALEARVPTLILQPLVENAIRHGLAGERRRGRVQVLAGIEGGRVRIRVIDEGPRLQGTTTPRRQGIGLRNTAERLQHLYGSDAGLELRVDPGRVTVAELDLPLRVTATEPSGPEPERTAEPGIGGTLPHLPTPGPILWVCAGALWVVQTWLMQLVSLGRVERWSSGMVGLCSSLAWALIAPLVLRLAAARPISGSYRLGRLGAHVGIGLSLAAALTVLVRVVVAPGQRIAGSGTTNLFTLNALIYCALLVWAHADRLIAVYRERTLAAARLEAELMQSRLQAESLRLRPGMLLDTLARAEALAEYEPEQAERLIERLADFLRGTLDASANGQGRNRGGPAVALGS